MEKYIPAKFEAAFFGIEKHRLNDGLGDYGRHVGNIIIHLKLPENNL